MDLKMIPPDVSPVSGYNQRNVTSKSSVIEPDTKTRASAHKVATEFEAMFAGMMLKSMRSSITPDKLTGGGRGEDVFQSLLDQEYATAIAQQGSLGISQTVEKQLLDDARRQAAVAARRNTVIKP
jgi:flagellar protein FlgJ